MIYGGALTFVGLRVPGRPIDPFSHLVDLPTSIPWAMALSIRDAIWGKVSTVGMDIAAVLQLARVLGAKADEIDSIGNLLSHKLSGVDWRGRDADSFRDDWLSKHRAQLMAISAALRDAATAAARNAYDQEQMSSR